MKTTLIPFSSALALLFATALASAEEGEVVERITSPRGLTTEIRRTVSSDVTEADLTQASALAAELIRQVEQARAAAADSGESAAEIRKARQLVTLIRQLLPGTQTSVRVTDKEGTVVYESRHESRQDDDVTVLQIHTTIDHLRPIAAAKEGEGPKGLQLTHADFLRTDVILHPSVVDRYLARAQQNESSADEYLALAEGEGVTLQTSADPNPLLEVREALLFAHRAARNRRYDEARKDLETAMAHLKQYRDAVPRGNEGEIAELLTAIAAVQVEIKAPETLEKLSRIFQRILKPGGRTTSAA